MNYCSSFVYCYKKVTECEIEIASLSRPDIDQSRLFRI